MSDLTEYLEVLGYGNESYLSPPNSQSKLPELLTISWNTTADLWVVLKDQTDAHGQELLLKMLAAIGHTPANTGLAVGPIQELGKQSPQPSVILFMGEEFSAQDFPEWGPQLRFTRSPAECLRDPGLKKIVWDDLKAIKAILVRTTN